MSDAIRIGNDVEGIKEARRSIMDILRCKACDHLKEDAIGAIVNLAKGTITTVNIEGCSIIMDQVKKRKKKGR